MDRPVKPWGLTILSAASEETYTCEETTMGSPRSASLWRNSYEHKSASVPDGRRERRVDFGPVSQKSGGAKIWRVRSDPQRIPARGGARLSRCCRKHASAQVHRRRHAEVYGFSHVRAGAGAGRVRR